MNYRNNINVISIEGIEIDEGSLWRFDESTNLLILVDDDEFITHKLDLNKFKNI